MLFCNFSLIDRIMISEAKYMCNFNLNIFIEVINKTKIDLISV
jgi:hypothetical protein